MKTKSTFMSALVGLLMLVGCGSDSPDSPGAESDRSGYSADTAEAVRVSATEEQTQALAQYMASKSVAPELDAHDKGAGQVVARPTATCDDSVFGGTYCWSGDTYCWFSNAGGPPRCGQRSKS